MEKPTQFNIFNPPEKVAGEKAKIIEKKSEKAGLEEAKRKATEAETREALREDGFRTVDELNREDKAKSRKTIEALKKKMGWTKEGKGLL